MENYSMRSLMFLPGHNDRLLDSASRSEADVLLLDLEDSVQPHKNKAVARQKIRERVSNGTFKNYKVFPRVNDRESGELLKDIYELTIEGVEGFMYPKSTKGEDIYFFGKLLETIEYEKKIPVGTFKIIALIETTGGVLNLQEICRACPNRLVALAFGCEDFVTDLHGQHDTEGLSIFTPRALIAMAAREHNVVPIDTVHIKVHDLEDLEKNLIIAKKLGFEGMLVLNPKEIPLVHKHFSPSEKEYDDAVEMLQLSKDAVEMGQGVAVKNGKFIGPPMVIAAKKIISRYNSIKNKSV